MALAEIRSEVLDSLFASPPTDPAIVTWNRLEGRPRRQEFDRCLRAEIRDPMWMLCRQWQFGEFAGEDAGSAVKAKIQVRTAPINRYEANHGTATAYDASLPLEARAEYESIDLEAKVGDEHVALNLLTRAQMGQHWFRLLSDKGLHEYGRAYLERFGFEDPIAGGEAEALLRSDPLAWATLEALKTRVVDGYCLWLAIYSKVHEDWVVAEIPDTSAQEQLQNLATAFSGWFHQIYYQPNPPADDTPVETAWVNESLEYRFRCSAPNDEPASDTQTILVADQYQLGHLDWYSFDVGDSNEPMLETVVPGPGVAKDEVPRTFLPGPIEFRGMPNARWWEFEDRKTDLGDIKASSTDLATLMLAEFALVYGNDWSLVPYDLDVGTVSGVLGVVVTDVFGVKTLVRRAEDVQIPGQQTWGMYCLTVTDDSLCCRLLLPPTTPVLQESQPLDRVMLTRDEMANMVWAIEDIVPGLVRGGVRGFEAANDLKRYFALKAGEANPNDTADAIDPDVLIQYQVGTTVAENWIPFVPEHLPNSNRQIQLRRARMPRVALGAPPDQFVHPRTAILRGGLPDTPFYVNEVEAPQAGAIVTRVFQRTRWWNGEIFTWLGRRKQTGRGQGSSGLEFDRIVPKEKVS